MPKGELDRAAPGFRRRVLAPNEVLWPQGAAADELGLVLQGELVAFADLREVGRVRGPDIVGETASFVADSTRSATLKAARPTTVLLLGQPELRALRRQGSRVYAALLAAAQKTAVRRITATNARLAEIAAGSYAAPRREEPGALLRLWRTVRPGLPKSPCPPPGPILRAQPGLGDIDAEMEALLAAGLEAEAVPEGQVILLEGEPGSSLYLVAAGKVEVLRNVRGDRAELLTTLGPGQQFGANTLVEGATRTASCVAAEPTWLYRMDRDVFQAFNGPAGILWRESVLATLATQTRRANAALQKALKGAGDRAGRPGPAEDGFRDLLQASGFLEALPTNEGELAKLSFVMDEDHLRNRKNRAR